MRGNREYTYMLLIMMTLAVVAACLTPACASAKAKKVNVIFYGHDRGYR